MSSKYIPNKGRVNKTIPFKAEWSSMAKYDYNTFLKHDIEEEYANPYLSEKKRIEAIALEDLSFKDYYKFPFHQAKYGSWVYDHNNNFIFQFENDVDCKRDKIISILNGEVGEYTRRDVRDNKGYIEVKVEDSWEKLLLIRGWGGLTGSGALNLNGEYASKIQDTLAEYIVEKLNK